MIDVQSFLGVNEVTSKNNIIKVLKAFLAEFLGNLLLNFFGCGSIMIMYFSSEHTPNFLHVAMAFGLTLYLSVQSLGHISGGHFNPAVTLGMLSVGNIPLIRALGYIIFQCVGAIVGSMLLKALIPVEYYMSGLGQNTLDSKITAIQGFGIELFLGFILVLVISAVCDPNRPDFRPVAPLAIGLAVTVGHLGFITLTGSSMNPARTLSSAVVSGVWEDHWVYWVGPITGGILAAVIYFFLLSASDKVDFAKSSHKLPETGRSALKLGG